MRLAVIISTSNRPTALIRLLRSLEGQIVPGKHRIIVAENGTASPLALDPNIPGLLHIHEPLPGKCRIQNEALKKTNEDILVFLDDDVVAGAGYLDAVERFFTTHPEFSAMKGRVLPLDDPKRLLGDKACYIELPLVDHGDQVVEVRGVVGANMAFRSIALKMLGGFDERLGPGAAGDEEETEISKRLRLAGFRIGYSPDALVYHEVNPARATREHFLALARRRGYCRTLHERHSLPKVVLNNLIAAIRLAAVKASKASPTRVAREERRLATAQGMLDGMKLQNKPVTRLIGVVQRLTEALNK